MHASLEALFTSYRQNGRPEPLGEVFDRSSPQLLAVALHLCSHPADAEDALQATFVAAIDGAASWNATKPLLPWLLGILTNQCRRIGERRARRREEELPDERQRGEPLLLEGGTPLAASERRDLIARLREHIDRLPVEQRQVLLLQLEHGLAPSEVAEVLGVPPGTVRMRLHRGLQALRGVLPASLAALLLAALPSRGIAAVRTAVVGHAAMGAALIGGSILMKKLLVVAAVVVLLGLGTAVLTPTWSAAPDAATSPAVLVQAPLDAPSDANIRRDEGEPARTAAPLPAATLPTAPSAGTGSLIVRTLRENGAPLPREPFRFFPEEGEMRPITRTRITDHAGEARIDGLAPGPWRVELLRDSDAKNATVAAGEVAEVRWTQLEEPERLFTLQCLVVHADGRPAAGATVTLGGIRWGEVAIGLTGSDGRFAAELRSNLGVGARLAGHIASPVRYCRPRDTIMLMLGGPEAVVGGTVVDGEGRPVAGATVEIGPRGSWAPKANADDLELPPSPQVEVTDGAGRCTVRELVATQLCVRIRASGFAEFEDTVETIAGTTQHVCWQLARGTLLQGSVIDKEGRPVRAGVQLLDTFVGRLCADDGTFRIANAPADAAEIEVNARGFVTRVVPAAAARPGSAPIVLQRRPRYTLRLVDERGQPLEGWFVCLMPRYEMPRTTDERGIVEVGVTTLVQPRLLVSPPGPRDQGRDAVLSLPWPANALPGAACDVVVPDAMAPDASVHGVVVAADGSTIARAHVELRSPGRMRLAMVEARGGSFHFAGVPAGDWQLWIRRDSRHAFDPPVHVNALAKGEQRDVGQVHAPADGSVRVTVRTTQGRRPTGLRFLLFDPRGEGSDLPVDGSYQELPAGKYPWNVLTEDASWRAGEIDVRAGERRELDLVLTPAGRCTLRIVLPGTSLADVPVDWTLRSSDGTLAFHERRLITEQRPNLGPGTWHVDVAADDGRRFTGSFDVPSLAPSLAPIRVELAPVR